MALLTRVLTICICIIAAQSRHHHDGVRHIFLEDPTSPSENNADEKIKAFHRIMDSFDYMFDDNENGFDDPEITSEEESPHQITRNKVKKETSSEISSKISRHVPNNDSDIVDLTKNKVKTTSDDKKSEKDKLDSENTDKDEVIDKQSDFLLTPVATIINTIADALVPNSGHVNQNFPTSNYVQNPIPTTMGNAMNSPNSNLYENQGMLGNNRIQTSNYPTNNMPNPGNNIVANGQPMYTLVTVPNNLGMQNNGVPNAYYPNNPSYGSNNPGINNSPPMYLVTLNNPPNNMAGLNNQPNNMGGPNNLGGIGNQPNGAGVLSEQPNIVMGNQPNVGAWDNQPNNIGFNNQPNNAAIVSNVPNNMVPINGQPTYYVLANAPNPGINNMAYGNQPNFIPANQPTNYVPTNNQPNNYALLNNQPNNLYLLNDQPNFATGNVPNTIYGINNQANNGLRVDNPPTNYYVIGNQPNNGLPLGNQPSNMVVLANQPNTMVSSNQPNNFVPLNVQNTANIPLYASFKDDEEVESSTTEKVIE